MLSENLQCLHSLWQLLHLVEGILILDTMTMIVTTWSVYVILLDSYGTLHVDLSY